MPEPNHSMYTSAISAESLACSLTNIRSATRNGTMMTPIETYKMALETMSREELIEYTAILLRSLDKLSIEVLNDISGNSKTDKRTVD